MNPTSLFSGRATDYALYRPSYPAEAITTILEGLDHPSQLVAADIGAGTGIGSRLLGDRKVKVFAIEPNADMRLAATGHPMVEFLCATAEVTGLSNASIDLVSCFQSFHWFNPTSLLEFRRILKSSGRLALVWGIWDEDDPFTKELGRLVFQASNNIAGLPTRESMVSTLLESPYFQKVRQTNVPYQQWLELPGLIGLAQSQGFVPLSGGEQQQLVAQLQKLHSQAADSSGKVCVVYRTDIYLAEPTAISLELQF
ncbi:class I SAM-dependent methyltransferase [Iningainema tapete]|uniref:Class I SAM-dependent methyltransferase n=1 Tax=Iningainema tapete BLCC-T55 TaxID=2748662 RepID=A0A8J6XEB1_9CYAN|nr:class I SAM-dependent methyltransferase [Iningainema tapete]MBD2773934.1 class I SAM-dependent methyltransferase [Iningainema tapete BLCC-T55]